MCICNDHKSVLFTQFVLKSFCNLNRWVCNVVLHGKECTWNIADIFIVYFLNCLPAGWLMVHGYWLFLLTRIYCLNCIIIHTDMRVNVHVYCVINTHALPFLTIMRQQTNNNNCYHYDYDCYHQNHQCYHRPWYHLSRNCICVHITDHNNYNQYK